MDKVTVSAAPLRHLLAALVGSPHEIRELQATRRLPGFENPLDVIIDEFNAAVDAHNKESSNAPR